MSNLGPFDPVVISASVIANLATDILKSRLDSISNAKLVSLLKQVGLREPDFVERVNNLLIQALTRYFETYPEYQLEGVLEFFRNTETADKIAGYVIDGEKINELEMQNALDQYLASQQISTLLIEKRNLDTSRIIPDFLECLS